MNQEAFKRYCRIHGSRINAIMTLIERGWTDEQIADRFHTTARTITVYRKALNGELTQYVQHVVPKDKWQAQNDLLAEIFWDLPNPPTWKSHIYIRDPDRLLKLAMEAAGTKFKNEGLKFMGFSTASWWDTQDRGYMPAARVPEINKALGMNIYTAGIVEVVDE